MDTFRGDFRQVDNIDIARRAVPLAAPAGRRVMNRQERTALESTASFGALFDSRANLVNEIMRLAAKPPAITLLAPSKVRFASKKPTKELTVALGLNFEFFGVAGAIVQPGVYGSNSPPELGTFISAGVGVFLNGGFSIGPTLTFIFGSTAKLSGDCFSVGADLAIPGGVFGGGAALVFSPPPFELIGFSVGVSAGLAGLPVTVSVQATSTALQPRIKL